MYPTYYTYNPSRMRKAEKAYFKQGKTSKINDKNYSCAKLHIKKLIVNIELQLCNGSLESKCTSLYNNQILNVRFTSSSKCILLVLLLSYINVSQSQIFVKCNRLNDIFCQNNQIYFSIFLICHDIKVLINTYKSKLRDCHLSQNK